MNDISKKEDGTIVHNFAKSKDGSPRTFKDEETF